MAGPAGAVDYVQCREMLRTKNELSAIAAKKEVEYEGTHALPTECSGWMLDEASKQGCSDALAREVGKRKVYMTLREPRKIKNFTLTEAYKKTPCGAKGFNKLYITMTELTQAASY